MALTQKLLKFVFPIIVIAILPLFLPLYLSYKLIKRIKGTTFMENLAGKVVLITGASSGIGEHLAYEYARRGACLALAARREDRLQAVAKKARGLGSPDVIVIRTDASKIEDCKRFIDQAVYHFGRVDHLVNNAGIAPICMLGDANYNSTAASIMDINFWGSVNCTRFAIPHLKKSKGKIVGIASMAVWMPVPKMSSYNASKAAVVSFYETLRVECDSHIGITIVNPGLIQSEISTPEFLAGFGGRESLKERASAKPLPTEVCARAIVDSACRGDLYLTVPSDYKIFFWMKTLYPEFTEWIFRWVFDR